MALNKLIYAVLFILLAVTGFAHEEEIDVKSIDHEIKDNSFDLPLEKITKKATDRLNKSSIALTIKNVLKEDRSLWGIFATGMIPIAVLLYAGEKTGAFNGAFSGANPPTMTKYVCPC